MCINCLGISTVCVIPVDNKSVVVELQLVPRLGWWSNSPVLLVSYGAGEAPSCTRKGEQCSGA